MRGDSDPEIFTLPDLEGVSHKAAFLFVKAVRELIASKRRCVAAISGGTTPRRLYALLGSSPYREQVDWGYVHFFWVDERCVPEGHEESNFGVVFETLLSKVPVPFENLHRIKGEEPPEQGARDYEDTLREFFGSLRWPVFDLVILGMGKEGHTASLFPGSKELKEKKRLAVAVYLKRPARDRITLTLPVINHASQVLFLVTGRSKAPVLSRILGEGHQRNSYPAGLIQPVRGRLIWLIDQEAASELKKKKPLIQPEEQDGSFEHL